MKKRADSNSILILIYAHPEFYPPTINCILNLSSSDFALDVLHLPHKNNEWKWPTNVNLISISNKVFSPRDHLLLSPIKKVSLLVQFALKAVTLIIKNRKRYSYILAYDPYALFVANLLKKTTNKSIFIWYHNHDVSPQLHKLKKLSLQSLIVYFENKWLDNIDLFTLPTKSRLSHFNIDKFPGHIQILPNYPSKKVFNYPLEKKNIHNQINLLFIGSIARGRGIENIISLLPLTISNISVHLKIVGYKADKKFLKEIEELIERKKIKTQVRICDPVPYTNLQSILKLGHVGIAFYLNNSIMDQTISTASNKMFEYAAFGMPVLTSNKNYQNIGNENSWQISTSFQANEFVKKLEYIINNYDRLSSQSYHAFTEKFNYEEVFKPLKEYILDIW
jgi:glycosyltransferase involved in cell wall biosynthesis